MSNAITELSLDSAPAEFWEIAAANGLASVFYQSKLLKLWQLHYGWSDKVLIAENCCLVGFVKKSLLGRCFWSLPFGWYGGVIGSQMNRDSLSMFLEHLVEGGYAESSIVQLGQSSELPDSICGHRRNQLMTHVLDLTISSEYAENTQRNLTKARAQEIEVQPLSSGQIPDALEMLAEHERITGKPRRIRPQFYRDLLQLAVGDGLGVSVRVAVAADRIIACHIYFRSRTDIFYFDSFANQQGRDLLANFVIFDEILQESRRCGLERFNFGASPEGDQNLIRFKESWGATPVAYSEFYRASRLRGAVQRLRGRR
jgi:hypothetical protein